MLQALLADRFQLAYHESTTNVRYYELRNVGPNPRLKPVDANATPPKPDCGEARCDTVLMGISMNYFAAMLAMRPDIVRPVQNATGLDGKFTFGLALGPPDSAISIFTALKDQLGLQLVPREGPLPVIVIDRAVKPAAN